MVIVLAVFFLVMQHPEASSVVFLGENLGFVACRSRWCCFACKFGPVRPPQARHVIL